MQRALSGVLVLVQLFDLVIHLATDQIEPLRITANVVILLWLVVMALGKTGQRTALLSAAAIGVYLLLNLIFLVLEGVTNPAQGDALRTTLFVLVGVTVILSIWLAYRLVPKSSELS
ncbi:hypothetical protein GC175_13280 [bacterium]|nr:hypothetical protein [bacterium]